MWNPVRKYPLLCVGTAAAASAAGTVYCFANFERAIGMFAVFGLILTIFLTSILACGLVKKVKGANDDTKFALKITSIGALLALFLIGWDSFNGGSSLSFWSGFRYAFAGSLMLSPWGSWTAHRLGNRNRTPKSKKVG